MQPGKRASHQRSKKGCATCRQRRVKCDEVHPQCLRCVKAKLQCDYTPGTPKVTGTTVVTSSGRRVERILLPKTEDISSLTIARPSHILPGETDVENQYLRYFHQETTSGFQSAWDWTLWNRLMLQGCHSEVFIRDAVVAIGALHKSLRTLADGQYGLDDESKDLAKLQRQFAYRKYGKALKRIQQAIDNGSGPRDALIACLLIVCFESHSGDRYKALTHAQHGLRIYHQQDYRPSHMEDDIADAFRNLDIQIATVNDGRTVAMHEELLEEDASIAATMPLVFVNLGEAKRYWHVIMRRCCHFVPTTWKHTEPNTFIRDFETKVPGSVTTTVGENIHTASFVVNDAVRSEQSKYYAEMCRWLIAFEPLFLSIRQDTKSTLREYVTATMLQIQGLNAKITLAGLVYTSEILYDAHIPDFKSMIRLANDVVKIRNSGSKTSYFSGLFVLDLGLVVPLFTLLLKCRDRVLRWQGIEILKQWHVECWWDPLLIIAIGRFIINVEEEGMVNGGNSGGEQGDTYGEKSSATGEEDAAAMCAEEKGGFEVDGKIRAMVTHGYSIPERCKLCDVSLYAKTEGSSPIHVCKGSDRIDAS
ncbi:hypothetical protein N0V90_004701 [Kalmusia sp. IMI 367209]|nr:hypothetical protein N0V90_004701 [Kalmusia sp. IMI 367209]